MPYLKLNTGPLYYELRNSVNNQGRPLVIFFNGWCLSARYWEETARRLEKDWPVLLYDGRGFGRSNPPTHPLPASYSATIESSVAELEAGLDALKLNQGQKYHVVGHSLGGVTAAHFASRAEARGKLASLTIINSGSFEPNARQGSSLSFFVNVFVLTKNLFDLPLIRRSVIARSINRPITIRASRAITQDFVQADARAALELSRSSLLMSTLRRYRRELEELKARLLLIVGDKDATIPPAGMYNIKRFKPTGHLVAFSDCGHLPMLENTERFVETLANHFRAAEADLLA
jgi:pimeloyl-ACP methyl ester carboxylesterase